MDSPAGTKTLVVDALARVFLHVDPNEAHGLGAVTGGDVDTSSGGQGHFFVGLKLGNLIPLWQIGVEVVLSQEAASFLDGAANRQGNAYGVLYRLPVEHGEGAGQTQADRTGARIGFVSEGYAAAAEYLGTRGELGVDLQTDDRLVLHRVNSCSTT